METISISKSNHDFKLKSWSELDIGDFYLHIHSKKFNVKTGRNSYFNIDDRSYHTRSKLLQESDYKNFVKCSFKVSCFADIDKLLYEWREQF